VLSVAGHAFIYVFLQQCIGPLLIIWRTAKGEAQASNIGWSIHIPRSVDDGRHTSGLVTSPEVNSLVALRPVVTLVRSNPEYKRQLIELDPQQPEIALQGS
jgi:hypothetical protein